MKILILAILTLSALNSWARVQLSVLSEAEVSNSTRISLVDIVETTGVPASIIKEMSAIEIDSHREYEAREVSQLLKEKLLPAFKQANLEPQIVIPAQVKIKMSAGISRSHLERRIKLHLQEAHPHAEMEVQLHSVPIVTSGDYFVDWSQVQAGSFILPFKELNTYNPKYASGQVRIKKQVPVAQRRLAMSERIQPNDFKMQWVDVTFSKESIASEQEIIGQPVSRSLNPGQPIWYSTLKREPAAKRGQILRATVGSESFEINLNVQAEEQGFIGDTIRVKALETQKEMSAVITGQDTVRIQ
ncbi:MAG: flagellar basal body P-ring formation chaperone FlgA [Bdellovibrionia bacterium]